MRRALILLAVLLVGLVVLDQVVRRQITDEVSRGAAAQFSAASADADVAGAFVLPQLLGGRLDRVDVRLDDAVIGDPAVRATAMTISVDGVAVELPPPSRLESIEVEGGSARVTLQEREVERLLQRDRPGWTADIVGGALRASGEVQGVPVTVVVGVVAEGDALLLRAREVDAGPLGAEGARVVAQAFDTTIPLAGLPDGVRVTGTTVGDDVLVLEATIAAGTLALLAG